MSKFIPNSFQVPNAVIDELMAELSGAELKCYLFVLRKTKGWNKEFDAISVAQFMEHCKLSNRAVIDACNRLVELGLLEQREGRNRIKIFSVKSYEISGCEESSLVKKVHSGCEESSQQVVKKVHTQNNNLNNTIQNTTLTGCNAPAREPTPKKKSALALLAEFGITEQLAEDFIALRKAKKAPITETALNRLQKQADLAKLPLPEVVAIMLERGWTGFQADWNWGGGQTKPQNGTQSEKRGNVNVQADWSGLIL